MLAIEKYFINVNIKMSDINSKNTNPKILLMWIGKINSN